MVPQRGGSRHFQKDVTALFLKLLKRGRLCCLQRLRQSPSPRHIRPKCMRNTDIHELSFFSIKVPFIGSLVSKTANRNYLGPRNLNPTHPCKLSTFPISPRRILPRFRATRAIVIQSTPYSAIKPFNPSNIIIPHPRDHQPPPCLTKRSTSTRRRTSVLRSPQPHTTL